MSNHADTIRRALNRASSLAVTAMPKFVAYREANVALDALVAENQRLRDALERIHFVARFDSEPYEIAMATLHGTPSVAQTLEDTHPTEGTEN